MSKDAEALRYAGAMGHTVAVVVTWDDGRRGVAMESCDKHSALFSARTEYVALSPTVYERTRRGWRMAR
jgi:hypothetical protein